MPQSSGSPDPDVVKLVEAASKELEKRKASHNNCPRCDTNDWSVRPIAISVIPLRGVPTSLPYSYFQSHVMMLQMVCKNCGNTIFHDLAVLGLALPPSR